MAVSTNKSVFALARSMASGTASSSRLISTSSPASASIAPLLSLVPTYADPTPLVRTNLDPSARPPLKPTHEIQVATLYLAAHHPYSLDLYSRFAVQSARSLGIPTTNPAHIPMSKELHTVPRGPFVHKKYQENFERRTHRRAIKVFDANREVVDLWLRYLKKNGIGGVGMRARVHEFVEFGFGRKEVEGLEKQIESVGGGVEEIEKAAAELIKALSEPAGGEEEHRRVLQGGEVGDKPDVTWVEAQTATPSASDTADLPSRETTEEISRGETEASISQDSPSPGKPVPASAKELAAEQRQTREATAVRSLSDADDPSREEASSVGSVHKAGEETPMEPGATPVPTMSSDEPPSGTIADGALPTTSETTSSSESPSTYDTSTSSSNASSQPPPKSSSDSKSADKTVSTEAVEQAATLQGAAAPPASSDPMGDSTGLTEALKSETEVEPLEGELTAGRTAGNATEPTSGVDLQGEPGSSSVPAAASAEGHAPDPDTSAEKLAPVQAEKTASDNRKAAKRDAEARDAIVEKPEPGREEPVKEPEKQ